MATLHFLLERLPTPIGPLQLVTDTHHGLRAIDWLDDEARLPLLLQRQYRGQTIALHDTPQASAAAHALRAYFAGDLDAIAALPVVLGGTDFQRQVWTALRGIPPGQTLSYRDFALRIGRPAAIRAVGLANGANPISVVLPCHRLIGSNAALTGYAGGLWRKHWLLAHEGALPVAAAMHHATPAPMGRH